jgi:hypothetical protein
MGKRQTSSAKNHCCVEPLVSGTNFALLRRSCSGKNKVCEDLSIEQQIIRKTACIYYTKPSYFAFVFIKERKIKNKNRLLYDRTSYKARSKLLDFD